MNTTWTRMLAAVIAVPALVIMFSTVADAQGPIASGQTLTGTISSAGQTDSWTFAATAGDAIIVRVGEVANNTFNPRIQLLSPTSVSLGISSSSSAAEIAVTATNTGTFTVRISDNTGTQTNSYRLTLAKTGASVVVSPGDTGGPLTNGVTYTGTIDTGDLDVWTVTATNGDAIVVRMGRITNVNGFTPWVRVYSPTGVEMSDNISGSVADEVAIRATNSGPFLVVVGDGNATPFSGSGDYRLTMAKTGDPVVVGPGDTGGPLTNGVTTIGTIDTGDLDVWTVTATNGDAIVVRMGRITNLNGFTPWVRVYSPTGVEMSDNISGSVADEVAIRATNSGPFLVVVGDGNATPFSGSGDYRLTMAKTGDPVVVSPGDTGGPLTNGVTTIGTIDTGDLDVWTVTATAGDAVVVRMGQITDVNSFTPWVRVYSPTGVEMSDSISGSVADEAAFTATNSGTFLVVVGDGNATPFSGTGDYRLTMAKTGDPVVVGPGDTGGPLTNGLTTIGTIDTGDLDVWTVTATAGDAVVVRMGRITNLNSFTPWVRVYSPTGVEMSDNISGSVADEAAFTATNSGPFLVVVGDGNATPFSGTGDYRLTMAKTGDPVVVGPGDTGGPLTNGLSNIGTIDTGDLDVWTVSANVGDAIVVRMGKTNDFSGNFTPWVRVYSPTGVPMGSSVTSVGAEVAIRATNSGPFLVVVGDGNSIFSGSGIYRLTLAQIPGAFLVPVGDEGGWLVNSNSQDGVITVGDLDMWKFCAGTGTNMLVQITTVTNTSGNFTPSIRLYGPDGALLNTAAGAPGTSFSRTATNSGMFTVVVGDGNSLLSGTGTYRLLATGITVCVSCSLSPQLATNVVGTAHTVTDLVFTNDDLAVGVPVNFSVTAGPNVGQSGTATTSLLGQGSFTYFGSGTTGPDTIRAIANFAGFLRTNTATKVWVTPFEGWQIAYFGSTGNPAGAPNADPDGDGVSNTNEFLAGFDPTDGTAYPHIISIVKTGNDVQVTYLGANGDNTWVPGFASRTNVLDFTKGAANGSYSNNFASTGRTNILSGGNGLGIVTNFVEAGGATNAPSRYYRVRIVP